jgi:hypothetical protein
MSAREAFARWRGWLARRRNREQDLERELRAHLDLEAEEREAAGASPEEARQAALRALGSPVLVKERVRESWGWTWLDRLQLHGEASLRRHPEEFWLYVVGRLRPGMRPAPVAAHIATQVRQWLLAHAAPTARERAEKCRRSRSSAG